MSQSPINPGRALTTGAPSSDDTVGATGVAYCGTDGPKGASIPCTSSDAIADNPCLAQSQIVSQPEIANACADVIGCVSQLMTRISTWIQGEIDSLGAIAGQAIGKLMQWICDETDAVCAVPGDIHRKLQCHIDDRVDRVVSVCRQYQPYIERAAKAARKQSPCASPSSADAPPVVSAPVTPASVPVITSAEIAAVSPLAGMWLPSGSDGVAVELAALPPEMWDQSSPQGWYLTLTRDAHSQCGAPVLKSSGSDCAVVGTLWVSSKIALPDGATQEVLRLLGVPDDAITCAADVAQTEPVNVNIDETLQVSLPSLPTLPDIAGLIAQVQRMAVDIEAFFRWLREQWAAIAEWWRTHVPPTKEQLCALLGPVYAQMLIPVGSRPFCDDLPLAMREMMTTLGVG